MTSDSIIIITMHNTSTDTSTATSTMLLLHVVLTSGPMCIVIHTSMQHNNIFKPVDDSTLDVDEICAVGVPTKEYIFLTCSWHTYHHLNFKVKAKNHFHSCMQPEAWSVY